MINVIGRFLLVSFAFIISIIVALICMVYLGGKELGASYVSEFTNGDPSLSFFNDIIGVGLFVMSVGPALTILPALIAIIVGEVAQVRSVIYYMIAGGLAVLAIPFLYTTGDGISYTIPNVKYMLIFSASGFISGFIYWALAGHRT